MLTNLGELRTRLPSVESAPFQLFTTLSLQAMKSLWRSVKKPILNNMCLLDDDRHEKRKPWEKGVKLEKGA